MPEPTASPAPRFTLRQLPVPAKLVLTCFLLTVGLGYTSAMIQLHMQHSDRDGTTLPTPANVVAVFAGKVWMAKDDEQKVVSRLEAIISGSPKGGLTSTNMTPAFFEKDEADYKKLAKEHPERVPQLDAERDGERHALIAWVNAAPERRQTAYDEDRFVLPPALAAKPFSDAYKDKGQPGVAKVRSIFRDRCARCHKPGADKGDVPLTTYEELTTFMPTAVAIPEGGGYVDSGKQMSLEKLTQSTHAHLLSFAVLFALTGLTFAFTSYPAVVRGIVGPVVLVAQAADVSCWWLARLPDCGPYFAMCILGTGGVVGLGLGAQIVLSLFSMYGPKGKTVLALLFAFAGGLGGLAYVTVIDPYLAAEKQKAAAKAAADKKKPAAENPPPKADVTPPKVGEVAVPPVSAGPSRLEKVLNGTFVPGKKSSWSGKTEGGMVRAFFDKDEEGYGAALEMNGPELPRLTEERKNEQAVVIKWVRAGADERKKAYEADQFTLPDELAGKPFTAEFKRDDKSVKVRSLFNARCAVCHKPGGDKEDAPLDTYEAIEKYFKPAGVATAPPAGEAPAGPATRDPIPAANE